MFMRKILLKKRNQRSAGQGSSRQWKSSSHELAAHNSPRVGGWGFEYCPSRSDTATLWQGCQYGKGGVCGTDNNTHRHHLITFLLVLYQKSVRLMLHALFLCPFRLREEQTSRGLPVIRPL